MEDPPPRVGLVAVRRVVTTGIVELLERMFVNDLVARVLPPPEAAQPVVTPAEVRAEQRPDTAAGAPAGRS